MTAPRPVAGSVSSRLTGCRVCDGEVRTVLDLGDLPLANGFRRETDPLTAVAPVRIVVCESCQHIQLGDTVHPDILFRAYPFRAGASLGWRDHVAAYVSGLPTGDGALAVDIGANDGTLVRALGAKGWHAVGVDPCPVGDEYPVLAAYWSWAIAETLVKRHGPARLLTAWNVLGHQDHPVGFLRACQHALHPEGSLVVETPWVVPILKAGAYDTFYHEHLNTWSLRALGAAAGKAGLVVTDVGLLPVHGGSLRVTLKRDGVESPVVQATLDHERRELRTLALDAFPHKVEEAKYRLGEWCAGHRMADNLVVGYGASARGMMLLNTIPDMALALQSVVDDTPEKQGLLTPGYPVPIERPSAWLRGVDAMVALSYPWAERMLGQARQWGFRGPMYVPFHGELT